MAACAAGDLLAAHISGSHCQIMPLRFPSPAIMIQTICSNWTPGAIPVSYKNNLMEIRTNRLVLREFIP